MKQTKEEDGEEVVAEANVYLLPNGKWGCANRIQFRGHQSQPELPESTVRFKQHSKILQISMQRESGIEREKKKSLYQGNAQSQHHPVNTVLGYFNDGRLYLLPMADTYEMNYASDESASQDVAKRGKSCAVGKRSAAAASSTSCVNGLEEAEDGDGETAPINGRTRPSGEKITESWLDLAVEMAAPPSTSKPNKPTSDYDEGPETKRMKCEGRPSSVMNGL